MKPNCIECETNNQVYDMGRMSTFAKTAIDCNGINQFYCNKCKVQFG